VAFVFSLTFVRSHTDLAPIRHHIAEAYKDGLLSPSERPRRRIHRYGHQFTECTALLLSIDDESDPFKAVLTPQLQSKYIGPCGELERSAAGIQTDDRTDYSRYWHGYRLYIWPMLERVSVETMRYINAGIMLITVAFFYFSMRRTVGGTPAAIVLIVLMALTDIWRIWPNTTHFLSMLVILAGTAIFGLLYTGQRNLTAAIVLAAVLGAVFNFVDFLINPPMMPMLLAFIVMATELRDTARPMPRINGQALAAAGFTALSWFGAYALTWLSYWMLALHFASNPDKRGAMILDQISLRLFGWQADAPVPIYPVIPTLTMILQSFLSVGSVFVAILAAALLVHARRHWPNFDRWRFLLLISPAVIPIVWFELLNNHTQTHSHFTYRSQSAAIAIELAAFLMAFPGPATLKSLLSDLWTSLQSPD
jgi:hypothetical protein